MQHKKMNLTTGQEWYKKLGLQLTVLVIIAGFITALSFPVVAQYRRKAYSLFRPYAYWEYPYRRGSDEIIETLENDGLKTFADYLKNSSLKQNLNQKGIVTILAPTDQAFRDLPASERKKIWQGERVLRYHIIPKEVTENDLKSGEILTLEGNSVKISFLPNERVQIINNNNKVNASYPPTLVLKGEIVNGQVNGEIKAVIIKIDKVLVPPNF